MPKKKKGKKGKKSKSSKKDRDDDKSSRTAVVAPAKEPEDPCVALAKLEAEIYCRTRERNRETCDCSREASAAATASTAPKNDKTEQENANNANATASAADDQKNEAGGPNDPCKYQCSSDGGQSRHHSWWHRTGCRMPGGRDDRYSPPPPLIPPLFPPLMNMAAAGPSSIDPMASMLAMMMGNPALLAGSAAGQAGVGGPFRDFGQPGRTLSDLNGRGGGRQWFGIPCMPKSPYGGGPWGSKSDQLSNKDRPDGNTKEEAAWREEKRKFCSQLRNLCDSNADSGSEAKKGSKDSVVVSVGKAVAEDGKKDERPKERNSMQADKVSAPAEAGSKIESRVKTEESTEWNHEKYAELTATKSLPDVDVTPLPNTPDRFPENGPNAGKEKPSKAVTGQEQEKPKSKKGMAK